MEPGIAHSFSPLSPGENAPLLSRGGGSTTLFLTFLVYPFLHLKHLPIKEKSQGPSGRALIFSILSRRKVFSPGDNGEKGWSPYAPHFLHFLPGLRDKMEKTISPGKMGVSFSPGITGENGEKGSHPGEKGSPRPSDRPPYAYARQGTSADAPLGEGAGTKQNSL